RTPATQVARDRKGLEKHLRHHDRATEVQDDAAVVEIRQDTGEALEVAVTCRPNHGTICGRMLMHDLRPDRRMDRDRNTELGAGQEHRDFPTGEVLTRAEV